MRAIIIQLSLYNPNVQLFTSVTFLSEFLSTGGIDSQSRFEPLNFYGMKILSTSFVQIICIVIYMLIIIYFMWIEMKLLLNLKWNYFSRFWSFIQIGLIGCAWSSIGIYIWQNKECKRISKLFETTNGYVNLQLISYISDILTFLLGFSCFFGTLKLIRLCRFNQRVYLFINTLKYAEKGIISFILMFLIIFVSFDCLFYLLFVSKMRSCSTLLDTTQMLF